MRTISRPQVPEDSIACDFTHMRIMKKQNLMNWSKCGQKNRHITDVLSTEHACLQILSALNSSISKAIIQHGVQELQDVHVQGELILD